MLENWRERRRRGVAADGPKRRKGLMSRRHFPFLWVLSSCQQPSGRDGRAISTPYVPRKQSPSRVWILLAFTLSSRHQTTVRLPFPALYIYMYRLFYVWAVCVCAHSREKKQEKRRAKGNESESKLFSPIHKCVGLYQASRSFGLVRSISRLPVPKETTRGRRKGGINKKRKKTSMFRYIYCVSKLSTATSALGGEGSLSMRLSNSRRDKERK